MLTEIGLFVAACVAAAAITWFIRGRALSRGKLDVPNARSSHRQPTPRGGGLAIVLVAVAVAVALWFFDSIHAHVTVALAVGGVAVAVVGFLDDEHGLPVLPRFGVHAAAAIAAVGSLSLMPGAAPVFPAIPQLVAAGILVVGIVWCINLFNFMDGIDGIAASEALFVLLASAVLASLSASSAELIPLRSLLCASAGACAGFLVWNWPPARIFMGDVGSGFLGFWLGTMAIALHVSGSLSIWTTAILAAVFIADATVTLLRRMIRGERLYEAHRSHAYQRLAIRYNSHLSVTAGLWIISLFVLAPLAFVSVRVPDSAAPLATATLVVAGAVCWLLGSGKESVPNSG